jgi:heme oxygenase
MPQPQIIQTLRAQTGAAHQALEDGIDLERRLGHPGGRAAVVRGFHRLHAAGEAVLAPWLSSVAELDFTARRRAQTVADDLTALGVAPASQALAPEIDSLGRALGWFYVLEGSSLGGRAIHKGLTTRGHDLTGLSFFDPYGETVGARWRDFTAVLDRETQSGRARSEDIVQGACEAFAFAHALLAVPKEAACPP